MTYFAVALILAAILATLVTVWQVDREKGGK